MNASQKSTLALEGAVILGRYLNRPSNDCKEEQKAWFEWQEQNNYEVVNLAVQIQDYAFNKSL